jgi:hypothetical protein
MPIPLAVGPIYRVRTAQPWTSGWRDSPSICSLADAERHLGHIVRTRHCWLAFDGTHLNETSTGFRLLGSCMDIITAKRLVELATHETLGRIPTVQ